MSNDDLLQKISTGVKFANHAQTVHDVSTELSKLDVDLPWKERPTVETEKEKAAREQRLAINQEVKEKPTHIRNILIGVGLGAFFLFIKRKKRVVTVQAGSRQIVSTDMYLTPNFQTKEYLVSSEIPEIKQYQFTQGELRNVLRNATVLQSGRDAYGKPFFISSGIRPASITARSGKYKGLSLVQILREKGYAPSSFGQHMDGSAVDFSVEEKKDLVGIFQWFKQKAEGEFANVITQLIIYIEDGVPNFIHLGVVSDVNKWEISAENKFLVSNIKTVIDENGQRKRETQFITYTRDVLKNLVVA